jgi:hypothetical protein
MNDEICAINSKEDMWLLYMILFFRQLDGESQKRVDESKEFNISKACA